MKINFEVQMTVRIMYNYILQHNYTSFSGISGVVFGIVCLVWSMQGISGGAITQVNLALFLIGFLFVVMNPIMLWNKARKQVKHTPVFKKPISYELSEEGITATQDGQSTHMGWDAVVKATATNVSVILYFSRVNAVIFPKEYLGNDYANVVKLIYTNVPNNRVKIRTVS